MLILRYGAVSVVALFFVTMSIGACSNSSTGYTEKPLLAKQQVDNTLLPELMLENGEIVTDCASYKASREHLRISERYRDQHTAKYYLQCSKYLVSDSVFEAAASVLRTMLLHVTPYDFPLSINPQFGAAPNLNDVGFVHLNDTTLLFEDEFTHITIKYKGIVSMLEVKQLTLNDTPSTHLLWIEEKAKTGNYVAYYPALITLLNGNSASKQAQGKPAVSSVYKSGY